MMEMYSLSFIILIFSVEATRRRFQSNHGHILRLVARHEDHSLFPVIPAVEDDFRPAIQFVPIGRIDDERPHSRLRTTTDPTASFQPTPVGATATISTNYELAVGSPVPF